jgi:hypothetical protein
MKTTESRGFANRESRGFANRVEEENFRYPRPQRRNTLANPGRGSARRIVLHVGAIPTGGFVQDRAATLAGKHLQMGRQFLDVVS